MGECSIVNRFEWPRVGKALYKCSPLTISLGSQVLRVGLMGCNSSRASVDMVLSALKDALQHCHKSKV